MITLSQRQIETTNSNISENIEVADREYFNDEIKRLRMAYIMANVPIPEHNELVKLVLKQEVGVLPDTPETLGKKMAEAINQCR